MAEKSGHNILDSDAVVETELHGVTPDMLDWWWVNMEKGYPLWEPNEHKSFVWEVPPGKGGKYGAIQIAEESIGGSPVIKARIKSLDPKTSPIPIEYDHATFAAGVMGPEEKVVAYVVHQYQAADYGTKVRSTSRMMMPVPPDVLKKMHEGWIRHAKSEMGRLEEFLPELYKLWQVVKDPEVNRQASFKIKK